MTQSVVLVLLLLSAVLLRGRVHDPAETLTIYTQFDRLPSPRSIESMKTEIDAIMLPLDLRLDWRQLDRAGHEVVAEVLVVNFKGACRADLLPPGGMSGSMLGEIHIVDGEILPFADIDCDQIRELMHSTLAISVNRDTLLGRAMARVLAHELYHYLARTTEHASDGIAKAFFSKNDLAASYMKFDERQLRLMLDRSALRGHSESSGVSETAGQ